LTATFSKDLAESIKKPNGTTFIQGLRELHQKADIADIIIKDADIQFTPNDPKVFAKQLQEWKEKARLYDEINGSSKPDTGDIQSRLKDALSVRKELISRLRRVRENRAQWVQYATSLSKRLEKRETTLAEHGLLNGAPFQNKGSGMERPTTSEPEVLNKELRATDRSRATPELAPPRLDRSLELPGSRDDNDLEGDTMVGTPGAITPKPAELSRVHGEPRTAIPELEKQTLGHRNNGSSSGRAARSGVLQVSEVAVEEPHELPRLAPVQETSSKSDAPANMPLASQEHHTSSTQGEAEDAEYDLPTGVGHDPTVTPVAKRQVEPSSDAPVVVSTRAVRKRKAKSSPQKVRIKTEIELSSPVAFLGIGSFEPQESLDLDEIGQKTITPKKKRRIHDPGFSFPGDGGTETDEYHYKHPPAFNDAVVRSPILGQLSTPQINPRREALRIAALQPKSSNKPILPRTSAKYTPAKRIRHVEAPDEIPFAEDGENESRTDATAQNRTHQETKLDACRRLSSLLNTTSPNSSLLQTPSSISNKKTPRTTGHEHRSTAERSKGRTAKRFEAFRDASNDPDEEPFRARPLWRLGLEHFKVNPDHNQGYDYAFRDVVRGREQRKCLPGCTNPDCCGNGFRKLAELTTGQVKDQSSGMDTQDERLLEDFLGGNIHKLQAMSADERQETLIQAKARDLANKHGKHRHAFERRQSPPGFWRADFPTTQEVQSDRAEAADFERELVRKRYEDAMRGGGKWMFRDEQFEYTFAYIDIDCAVPDAQLIDTMADTGPELEHDDSISSQDPHNKKTKKIKNRRPANTAFRQQRLKAWQPILTPKTVLPLFFAIGIIFAPIGGALLYASAQVQEVTLDYTNCFKDAPNSTTPTEEMTEGLATWHFHDVVNTVPKALWSRQTISYTYPNGVKLDNVTQCSLIFDIPAPMNPPVLFYYRLTDFYQNHRRYVKSFQPDQLRGVAVDSGTIDSSLCEPLRLDDRGRPYYPCGLIANSMFNDTYTSPVLQNVQGGNEQSKVYDMKNNSGIAWDSDKKLYGKTKYALNQIAVPPNWVERYGGRDYTEEHPPPDLENDQAFQVWMRTAGLPTFSKLAQRNDDDVMENGRYRVDINHLFPADIYGGTKSIIISTRTVIGGRNPYLGIAFVVVGGLCILLGAIFTATHLIKPRKLGDHTYLSWNNDQPSTATTTGREGGREGA
ncbi:hypothetical protein V490_07959, partial [Pseudogymnoascus sp. VKM F-3557]